MEVSTNHLRTVRRAYRESPSEDLARLYVDMAKSAKRPVATAPMLNAAKLILNGNKTGEAAKLLNVSEVSVRTSALAGFNRFAVFYRVLGFDLPAELEGEFNYRTSRKNIELLSRAMKLYENPIDSILL